MLKGYAAYSFDIHIHIAFEKLEKLFLLYLKLLLRVFDNIPATFDIIPATFTHTFLYSTKEPCFSLKSTYLYQFIKYNMNDHRGNLKFVRYASILNEYRGISILFSVHI